MVKCGSFGCYFPGFEFLGFLSIFYKIYTFTFENDTPNKSIACTLTSFENSGIKLYLKYKNFLSEKRKYYELKNKMSEDELEKFTTWDSGMEHFYTINGDSKVPGAHVLCNEFKCYLKDTGKISLSSNTSSRESSYESSGENPEENENNFKIGISVQTNCEDLKEFQTLKDLSIMIKDIGEALQFFYSKNIYHMDIKPGNIVWCNDKYKLVDLQSLKMGKDDHDYTYAESYSFKETDDEILSKFYNSVKSDFLKKDFKTDDQSASEYQFLATCYELYSIIEKENENITSFLTYVDTSLKNAQINLLNILLQNRGLVKVSEK